MGARMWYVRRMEDTLTPDVAAAKIVADLLSDLSEERRRLVGEAIEAAIREWGELVGATSLEFTHR